MKCPKCGYLGFETGNRCKNCGYDFSLMAAAVPVMPELPLRELSPHEGPLLDAPLGTPDGDDGVEDRPEPDLDRLIGVPDADPATWTTDDARSAPADPTPGPARRPTDSRPSTGDLRPTSSDLPLFSLAPDPEDLPLIAAPAGPPRKPVAVRRSAPETPRARVTPDPARLRRSPWGTEARPHPRAPRMPEPALDLQPERSGEPAPPLPETALPGATASAGRRVLAAAIDAALFVAIDLAVLYFTLRIANLRFDEVRLLPMLPLASFLVLLKLGYLAAFTAAGGQTIGKMALGLRVVAADSSHVPIAAAIVRASVLLVTLLPAGLAWVPSLFGAGRGLHDRAAGTRVVPARPA